jgi:hypothetical protein
MGTSWFPMVVPTISVVNATSCTLDCVTRTVSGGGWLVAFSEESQADSNNASVRIVVIPGLTRNPFFNIPESHGDPGFRRDDILSLRDPGFRRDDILSLGDPGFRRDDALCLTA